MSEEFIRVYKPVIARSQASIETTTPKRSKSKSRKSVSRSAKKDTKPRENFTSTDENDVLLKIFNSFDEKINNIKKTIHKDLFESIYANTIQYFGFYESKRQLFDSKSDRTQSSDHVTSLGLNPICNVIPTVALYTGINVQDYAYLCDKLSGSLRDNFTEYLFFVNEKNAHSIKSLVNAIYTQWENIIDEDESAKPLPKRNMFTFRQFFQSIQAMNKEREKPKSVVFFFKQFELIPKETIECFVSLISCYVENVAIYFILELASQSNIINQQLSSGVISKLCIKKLYLMSPSQYIDKFISHLFIESNILFKVSGDILKYLVELYNDYNYSISTLIHALKFCFFDHLHSNPLNAIMLSEELDDFQLFEQVYEQTINQNEANRELFTQTVNCDGNQSVSVCLQRIQTHMRQYTSEFLLVAQLLFEIVKHFPMSPQGGGNYPHGNETTSLLFGNNIEASTVMSNVSTFSEMYVRVWAWSSGGGGGSGGGSLCESEEFAHLRRLLQLTSSSTMSGMIESMVSLVETRAMENEASYDAEFLNELFTFHDDILELMKTKLAALCNPDLNRSFNEEEEENEEIAELKSSVAKVKRSKSLMVSRRPSIRSNAAAPAISTLKPISENSPTKKPPKSTKTTTTTLTSLALARREDKLKLTREIDELKSKMIAWLSDKFNRYFNHKTFSSQPFMRHFCYSDLGRLKRAVCDVQRLNVHACLVNSFEHVRNSMDFGGAQMETSPSSQKRRRNSRPFKEAHGLDLNHAGLGLLPINIVYRLYLECGHMINLHDWLQAFVEKMENVGIDELPEAKRKQLIALFFRSITELQFMGYIKPTSRKVDHVVKLTNGSGVLALEA